MGQLKLTDIETDTDADGESDGERYLVIAHQPTRHDLADAIRSCLAHANQIVGGDGVDAAPRARYARQIASGDLPLNSDGFSVSGGGFVAGIEDRQCVRYGVRVIEATDDMRHAVVDSIETLGETHSEIRDHVETIVQSGAELHLNDTGVVIDSENCDALLGVMDSLDKGGVELQRAAAVRDVRDWLDGQDTPSHGRPPLGFDKVDGKLVPAGNIDEVRAVLSMDPGPEGDISKQEAADRLGVSTRTINRALDNLARYGLDDTGE